jgi:hypothetical protein
MDIIPYHTPMPAKPNFGQRAAKVSLWAALAAFLLVVLTFNLLIFQVGGKIWILTLFGSALLAVIGMVFSVVALAFTQPYGRRGILLPAIIGLCLNIAMFLAVGLFAFVMDLLTSGSPM